MKNNIVIKKAIKLREKGFSFREISEGLKISKSTASLWLRNVKLSKKAEKRIRDLGDSGRKKGVETNRKKRCLEKEKIKRKVKKYFSNSERIKIDSKVACALLYWCEGTKCDGNKSVIFANADPEMIKYFLYAFRKSFDVDDNKFRALIHLHKYHNIEKQLDFWSKTTKIPISQFNKSYIKKNTGKTKKENYPGCISIKYSDIKIYDEMMFVIDKLKRFK